MIKLFTKTVVPFALATILAVGAFAAPAPAGKPQMESQPSADAAMSASGKVVGVADAALTLEVKKGGKSQSVAFVTDKDTKVEGTLAVGAEAEVTYRQRDGNNVALAIRVAQK